MNVKDFVTLWNSCLLVWFYVWGLGEWVWVGGMGMGSLCAWGVGWGWTGGNCFLGLKCIWDFSSSGKSGSLFRVSKLRQCCATQPSHMISNAGGISAKCWLGRFFVVAVLRGCRTLDSLKVRGLGPVCFSRCGILTRPGEIRTEIYVYFHFHSCLKSDTF